MIFKNQGLNVILRTALTVSHCFYLLSSYIFNFIQILILYLMYTLWSMHWTQEVSGKEKPQI